MRVEPRGFDWIIFLYTVPEFRVCCMGGCCDHRNRYTTGIQYRNIYLLDTLWENEKLLRDWAKDIIFECVAFSQVQVFSSLCWHYNREFKLIVPVGSFHIPSLVTL